MAAKHSDVCIIGGGFFGCSLAVAFADQGYRVILVEERSALMERASYNNQARVHNGYHYPRSILTALRSRINFPKWIAAYQACVVNDFDKYYAVARRFSKVSASQFAGFMRRVGASLSNAPKEIEQMFNPGLIEQVFTVKEFAFDAARLADLMRFELDRARVEVKVRTRAVNVAESIGGLSVTLAQELVGESDRLETRHVFNCTYSQINDLLTASHLPLIRLKHELAEMALIEVPEPLKKVGITVMCGPFFSLMPFPSRGLHTLSHVRYTPHAAWEDTVSLYRGQSSFKAGVRPPSHFRHMLADAQRYMPILETCHQVDSLWEIKTVLPASEGDDSRPILFRRDAGLRNLHCVMGAKIDNIFDALAECTHVV